MKSTTSSSEREATAPEKASGNASRNSATFRSRRGGKGLKATGGFFIATLIAACPPFFGIGSYWTYVAGLTLIYLLGTAGLNLILGYAGQISLAQGAFMGVGGYTVAILGAHHHWPILASLLAGAAFGFFFGLAVGAPAIRVATHYLAMVTLGVQVIYQLVAIHQAGLTGGALGINGIPRPSIFGFALNTDDRYYVFITVVVFLVLAVLYVILNSTWGRAFKSIRENEMRASMLGVNVRAYKLLAFAIGCSAAAVAGGLLASSIGYVDPDTFPLTLSFQLLLMVVVGGKGRFEAPLLGAVLVTVLPELLRGTQNMYLIVFSVMTILVLIFMPKGLITMWDYAYLKLLRRPAPQLTK